jgi:DNA damage-binding protein 2
MYAQSASHKSRICGLRLAPRADARIGGSAAGRHIYSMDADCSRGALLVGDDAGGVHVLDPRAQRAAGSFQAAKKGTKVVALSVCPRDPSVFVTGGNDHNARIWDIRACGLAGGDATAADATGSGAAGATAAGGGAAARALSLSLATLAHPRVVNAAVFSPITGRKLLTTCQDNRLRVWDHWGAGGTTPDRELVHSHDFSRYLTPFKAQFDPKDPSESGFLIGRYISEDYNGTALHPIDMLSAKTGRLLSALTDANVQTICTVVTPHPTRDVIAAGSSRNIFVWEPVLEEDEAEGAAARAEADAARGGGESAGARARAAIPRMLDLDEGDKKKKKGRAQRDEDEDEGGPSKGKKKGRGGA